MQQATVSLITTLLLRIMVQTLDASHSVCIQFIIVSQTIILINLVKERSYTLTLPVEQ